MKKTVSGTTTQFLYDGLNPVQELNSSNVATANLLTGLNIDEFFSRTDSSGARSLLTDMLGSTLALTDSSGTIQTQYTYEPFGNVTVSGAANGNSYQFTGRENDGTGLYFYRARYYSQTFQRFIAQDPIGFHGRDANLYGYVRNSPGNFRDRFGLQDEPPFDPEDPSDPQNPENPYGDNPALQPEPRASTPIGRRGHPIQIPTPFSEPADICGTKYTGHALDEMSSEGVMPSVVEEAIQNGSKMPGNDDRTVHIDLNNGVTVVTELDGTVVTVYLNKRE